MASSEGANDDKAYKDTAPTIAWRRLPVLIPPENFGMVAAGVYRASYPDRRNFTFLKKLKLKSIV